MSDPLAIILLVVGAFAASILAAVTGFGSSAILMPILIPVFRVRDAIPILTVAQLVGNGSRLWFNRRELALPVVGWFSVGAVPAALLGGALFASAPLSALTRVLGLFLLAVVAYRHAAKGRTPRMRLRWFAPVGAVSSFVSALLGTVGPLLAPFFLASGLVKGAFIGTESLCAVVMHASKLVAYGGMSVLSPGNVGIGLLMGAVMVLGSMIGKRVVDRVSERAFVLLIEATLVGAGVLFLVRGG